jgi:hypothetical protein
VRNTFGNEFAPLDPDRLAGTELVMMSASRFATYASFLAYGAVLTWVIMAVFLHR